MTTADSVKSSVLEGHFACGSGLLIGTECLGRSYKSKTTGRDLTLSIPRLPDDWQGDGFLNPPAWRYSPFRDAEPEELLSDESFKWGASVGFTDNPDGSQSPEFARVLRWRFDAEIEYGGTAFEFFKARETAVREIESWWDLTSSWISIFTKQDFVDIGKTRSGIRVGPIVTWLGGDADGMRVNGSKDTSIPIVNDVGVDHLTEATLTRCITLAASGTQPPIEWLLIRDARSLVNAKQYRRAVIDACTAAEISVTALIDNKFDADGTAAADRKKEFDSHHGISKLRSLHKKVGAAGVLPKRLVENVGALRNRAARREYHPTPDETALAIQTATVVVELASPLTNFS